jgi:hypothetical protein
VRERADAEANSTVGFVFLDQSRSSTGQNIEHNLDGVPILPVLPAYIAPIAWPKGL